MVASSPRLLSTILDCLSPTRLIQYLDLYRTLRQWWQQHRKQGMYEILNYDSTLELVDAKGQKAIFTKQQRVKFIQDHIIAFEDYAWGDGEIFADYRCSPGVVVDRYQDGDRWNVLISLRETKNSVDVEDFYIERTAKKGFMKAEEAFQTEIRHKTKRLKMSIIFPKERLCQRAVLMKRSQHQSEELGPEHFITLPDGRQRLIWETRKIRRFEIYTIKWRW